MGRTTLVLLVSTVTCLCAAAPATAQDSAAPDGALPHWLPSDTWVYQHWLPFDEGRLYEVLRADRGAIWRHLRDDAAHDLAQLGRKRGMDPRRLAAALVAPRARRVSPRRAASLRSRAYRVVTQGHLSQHIIFHSLHQSAVPNRAAWIFGVERAEFLRQRRAELGPLQIGRLHGRTNGEMRRRAEYVLRGMAARGVREGHFSAGQARLLLDRQLRQLPRWLGQSRYNGPPQTSAESKPLLPQADFANNPSLSADGRHLVWDAYRAKIPEAKALGEIRVMRADLVEGGVKEVSARPGRERRQTPGGPLRPRSAYNAALAADGGAVVFEASEGNLNFAKRYSEMQVQLGVLRRTAWDTVAVSHPRGSRSAPSRTAYNPSVSADGARVAFEATDAGRDGRPSRNGLFVVDRATGRERLVGRGSGGGAVYGPRLSADGRFVVFTAEDAASDGHSLVFRRTVDTGATELVSRVDGASGVAADDDAQEPSVSRDGSVVAFTSSARNLGAAGSAVWARDLRRGRTIRVGGGSARAFAFDPAISADGRFVAYAERVGARADAAVIRLHDLRTGVDRRLSGAGYASEPVVSDGARRVAWSSTVAAANKIGGVTGVFVHERATRTTRLLSSHAPLQPKAPARASLVRGRKPGAAHGAFGCLLTT